VSGSKGCAGFFSEVQRGHRSIVSMNVAELVVGRMPRERELLPSFPEDHEKTGTFPLTYDRFVELHRGRLLALGRSLTGSVEDGNDLAQEALLRAWQNWERISSFDVPEAWVRRVLLNLATSQWRRSRLRSVVSLPPEMEAPPGVDIDEVLDLMQALEHLKPLQRYVLHRHYADGIEPNEIAAELGENGNTVRSWLTRGRKALTKQLGIEETRSSPRGDLHE
jgi:RNA polymerase sigma-70 factor, ECF subfamily